MQTATLCVRNSIRNASVTKVNGRNLQRCAGVREKIYDFSPTFLHTDCSQLSEDEQTLSHRNVGSGISIHSAETLVFPLCFLCGGFPFRELAEDPQLCTIISQCSVCRLTFPYLHLDHKYLLTYLLTPCSTVILEKLTGSQLVKKFYGTRSFITAFTSARHLYLS